MPKKVTRKSKCPHVVTIGDIDFDELADKLNDVSCKVCGTNSDDLWLCLRDDCLFIGCGDYSNNHSGEHETETLHPLSLNCKTQRIWCNQCQCEVFLDANTPSVLRFTDKVSSPSRVSSTHDNESVVDGKRIIPSLSCVFDYADYQGPNGLYNLGNTCFMNSVLQCLINCPLLSTYFLDYDVVIRSHKRKLTLAMIYSKFVREMMLGPRDAILSPSEILAFVCTVYPNFRGDNQQDAQEFLRCFLDQVHEDLRSQDYYDSYNDSSIAAEDESDQFENCRSSFSLNSLETNPSLDSGVSIRPFVALPIPTEHICQVSSPKAIDEPNSSSSIISELFDGLIRSQVKCLTCERISSVKEVFQDLSIPVPSRDQLQVQKCQEILRYDYKFGWIQAFLDWLYPWFFAIKRYFSAQSITIHDSLESFFSDDELKGDNMYSCEKCKKLRNGLKCCKIISLPEILCIHLKRFRHDFLTCRKINNYVLFPLVDLDMSPYLDKDCKDENPVYDLFGVICHDGNSGGGHYRAYCLNHLDGQWYEFNDGLVKPVDSSYVLFVQAYVLFYAKRSGEKMKDYRLRVKQLFTKKQDNLLAYYISKKWLNKFFLGSNPGPISNSDFICAHGGVKPHLWQGIDTIVVSISQEVWEYLHERFGGGPGSTRLYPCKFCQLEEEKLMRRQQYEKSTFLKLVEEESQSEPHYALSLKWFKMWEHFVQGHSLRPPGSIDNSSICSSKLDDTLVLNSNATYVGVNERVWEFFHTTYGGGPQLIVRPGRLNPQSETDEDIFYKIPTSSPCSLQLEMLNDKNN